MSELTVEKAQSAVIEDAISAAEVGEKEEKEEEEPKVPSKMDQTKTATVKGVGDKTQMFNDAFHTNIQVPPKHILPKVEENPGKYTPMPYIFRLPSTATSGNVINQATRTPPFYVQLDHAIAVIWALFNSGEFEKSLGINQMQWALAFLRTIKNQKGRTPKDVAFCIEIISNELLEQYADLVDDVSMKYETPEPIATSSRAEITKTLGSRVPSQGEVEKIAEDFKESNGEILVQRDVPFSINYADMVSRSPPRAVDNAKAKPDCPEDEMSKNMGGFLSQWRKEQMKKILLELDRLNSIEKYMGNSGGNFEPYMDDKDKEIAVLLTERMKQARFN